MKKKWILKERPDRVVVKQLMGATGYAEPLAVLMVQRGITTPAEAEAFFTPRYDVLHDPFLMKDMNIAVDRISSAIDKNEKILIYGDYDVDGTTSVALLYSFLSRFSSNLDYYIPDRYSEGYGVSKEGLDYAQRNNCRVVVTLDCGIKAVEKARYARQLGLDLIICDHHLPGDTIPEAVAVLDPKQPGCNYPYKDLSGCGVGFKFIQAYARVNNIPFSEITPYLDLVAVSIASDIVPVTGENRVLAYYGLRQLNSSPRIGLKEIINSSSSGNREFTIEDVVFKIGPRINAAGRMNSGRKAVELLVSEDITKARAISLEIEECNNNRRTVDTRITTEALRNISDDQRHSNVRTTVLYNPEWSKGVIGIVASRLIETHYRPTVILTESNGLATGSARSVAGYDLYQAIEECSDLLENFGGHMYAAGLTLKKENVKPFARRFEEVVSATITEEQMTPRVEVDIEIGFDQISIDFFTLLNRFQPYGPLNMAPVFLTRNVEDTGKGRVVGAGDEHLKLELCSEATGTGTVPAIAFGLGNMKDIIYSRTPVDIVYTIEMNEFRGTRTLQINIKDIRPSSEN
ncbi:MAG: single-stranded-DNA-specific exonuclease RecJ [Bacteroidales bacterium]|nr:single-stranded-DNA-specific exonuclease RecJ [Bacteroidales bacterium]